MKIRKFNLFWHFFLILLYLEFLYKLSIFNFSNIFNLGTIIMIVSLIPIALVYSFITKIFKEDINIKLLYVYVFLLCLWYGIALFFKIILDTYFSVSHLILANQVFEFANIATEVIIKNSILFFLILLPIAFTILMHKNNKLNLNKCPKEKTIKRLGIIVIAFVVSLLTIIVNKEARSLFFKENNYSLAVEKLGIALSSDIDIYRSFFGFEEKIIIPDNISSSKKTEKIDDESEVVYKPNKLNIDFSLMNQTEDSRIKDMNDYFALDHGTLQNEYTGLYKGKNLIYVVAESLSDIAVDKELTPTLYKMANESFVFKNFYTPVNLSTIGGEFQALTSLFAEKSMLDSRWKKAAIKMPYGLANIFKESNYNTFAFHNHNYWFQSRHMYLKMIGFDNYLACRNGLEKRMDCNPWPRSDEDMINGTVHDYADKGPFMTYYMTNSGHSPYTSTTSYLARKNYSKVKKLPYSTAAKVYLAYNIDLDLAMGSLIQKLEEKGVLDDTVIVIVADHYPYFLPLNDINEISTYERDSVIEKNRNTLIIWNNKTEKKVIEKVSGQLDVIPTVYNLFGLKYDSRLFMGKDILSTEPGLVFFENRSWITDKGKYFTNKREFVPSEKLENKEEYIQNISSIVRNRVNMSKSIIEKDYYGKIRVK